MMISIPVLRVAALIGLGLVQAACAPKPAQLPAMAAHTMPDMDMQGMMSQCADMRRQMAQGTHPNMPDMASMMAHCDAMDHSMPMPSSGPSAAPAATRSR